MIAELKSETLWIIWLETTTWSLIRQRRSELDQNARWRKYARKLFMYKNSHNIFCTAPRNGKKNGDSIFKARKYATKIVSIHLHQSNLHGLATHQARSDIQEQIFSAMKR